MATTGVVVGLWTRSGILTKKNFLLKNYDAALAAAAGLPQGGGYLKDFLIYSFFLLFGPKLNI